MFSVVNFHRTGIDVGFECIERIGQGGQRAGY